jgi:hypothetical protein
MNRKSQSTHESFERDASRMGSDRSFGFVFFVAFAIIGFLWRESWAQWAWYTASLMVLMVALVAPSLMRPFNKAWHMLGLMMGRVMTPIVMAILFYLVVTPTGLIMRTLGKDPMRLRIEKETKSYWIDRQPPGPDPKSMNLQF